jgi:hypothetical protein
MPADTMRPKDTVFIHTNDKQMIGALVSLHSMKRNSKTPAAFDVRIIRTEDYDFYHQMNGKSYLREGRMAVWDMDDLQSFTTTRFMPPELMGYQGKSIVVDPDVFAVQDVAELLNRDMQGKGVMARFRSGHKGYEYYIATSVMLMDNGKLKHWSVRRDFLSMFESKLDYEKWMRLALEPMENVGRFEDNWNDFDKLDRNTKLIHNTKRRTQPWKTGLDVDYTNRLPGLSKIPLFAKLGWLKRVRLPGRYWKHPDHRQEAYFFALLKEGLAQGSIPRDVVEQHIAQKNVRSDAFDVLKNAPDVDEIKRSLQ